MMEARFPWCRTKPQGQRAHNAAEKPPAGRRIIEKASTSRSVTFTESEFMRLLGLRGEVPFHVSVGGGEITVWLMSREG